MTDNPKAQALSATLQRKNSDGTPYYSDADVRHWLPLIIIASRLPPNTWSLEMHRGMADLLMGAKLDLGADHGARLMSKIYAYYDKNPGNKELKAELAGLVKGLKSDKQDEVGVHAASALRAAASTAKTDGPTGFSH